MPATTRTVLPTVTDLIPAVGYLRLSDARLEEALEGRRELLKAHAAGLGWRLDDDGIIVENDLAPGNGDGTLRPASAWKRQRVKLPNGRVELRTIRPGFRKLLAEIASGRARGVLCEDLDRLVRQPGDGEDLIDYVELYGATVRSLSESVTLTNGGTPNEQYAARNLINAAAKSSADTARRVSNARSRLAGQSYGGGIRPYGYEPDPATRLDLVGDRAKYHRKLIIVEAEAAVIRQAAADLLRKISLKAVTRDLRENHVPTVTGTEWNTRTLRDVLLKPTVAGLTPKGRPPARGQEDTRPLVPASWEPILDRATWDRLADLLRDPARRTTTRRGTEPRWLVSVFATCGVCGGTLKVGGAGRGRGPAYVGTECGHIRRDAAKVDHLVGEVVIRWLEAYADSGRLRPPPRARVDEARLRADRRKLLARMEHQADMHMRGALSDRALEAGQRTAAELVAAIDAQLDATDEPDPLEEFRGHPARQVWEATPMARKRALVQALIASVVIQQTGRGRRFDPETIELTWRPQAGGPS